MVFQPRLHPFWGNPNARVSAINTGGGIVTSRDAEEVAGTITLYTPAILHVSASAITSTGIIVDADEAEVDTLFHVPYNDLEFRWDGGNPDADTLTNPATGIQVSTNSQGGGDAVFLYRDPGTYTVTLYIRAIESIDANDNPVYIEDSVTLEIDVLDFEDIPGYNGEIYVDPDNGNDTTGDGTIGNPYKNTFGSGATAKQKWLVKRGTGAWHRSSLINLHSGTTPFNYLRIGSYGSGAKPRFTADGGLFFISTDDMERHDIVFSDLDIEATDNNGGALIAAGFATDPQDAFNIYCIDCDFHSDTSHSGLHSIGTGSFGHAFNFGYWNCTFVNPPETTSPANTGCLFGSAYEWHFITGGEVSGACSNAVFDHNWYPNTHEHFLARWTHFGDGENAGGAVNGNFEHPLPGDVEPGWDYAKYWLVSGCLFTGADFQGFEMGGGATRNVFFRETIMERCVGHDIGDDLDSSWLSWYGMSIDTTFRFNECWNLDYSGIHLGGAGAVPGTDLEQLPPYTTDTNPPKIIYKAYGNNIHRKFTSLSGALWNTSSAGMFTDNYFIDERPVPVPTGFADFSDMVTYGAVVDRNTYYTPNGTRLVAEGAGTGSSLATFNSETGSIYELNSVTTAPDWVRPEAGEFETRAGARKFKMCGA